ncbi:MAG: hypothetical protein MUE85_24795 [Microscillaceae bacterium]|nr:hypothetical protein [Microscillaceae bacterium]
MILYETEHLKIELDDEISAMIVTWRGFTSSEEFRAGVDKILALMAEHDVKRTITDLSEHRVISTEDQDYAAHASLHFTRDHWQVKRALITPKDVFTRFGIKQVNAQIAKEEQQNRQFFATMEEARVWITMED